MVINVLIAIRRP